MLVETRTLALVLLLCPQPPRRQAELASAEASGEVRIPRPLAPFVDKPAPLEPFVAPFPPDASPLLGRGAPRAKVAPFVSPLVQQKVGAWHGLAFDEPGDGRLWARGENYKASFDREGLTFVPFLGSDAPRNYPVTFRLSSASVDGAPIALDGDGSLSRVDRRVTIERGVADEVYDLTERSVEQTIVVESLPARGELVLAIDVTTDLDAHVEDGVVRFANERGGVDYGRVTVLDRDDRAYTTSATLVDGDLRIEVPASYVESASLPLRVDPLITTAILGPGPVDENSSDTSYDAFTGHWIVVFEYAYSAADHDVYAQVFDSAGSGTPLATAFVDATTDYWWLPSVANNLLARQFLAVASVYPAAGGASTVKGRTLAASNLASSPQFTISGSEGGGKTHAMVGGDPATIGPTYYCVVWQRDFSASDRDIHARLVDTSGIPLGGGPILVDNSPGTIDTTPAISKCDGGLPGSTQEWNIVWQRFTPATLTDVYAAQIHWDGTITTPSMAIDASSSDDFHPLASSPMDVPSGPRPWLIAFERQYAADRDIQGVSMLGGSNFGSVPLTAMNGTNLFEDQALTGLDCDGRAFVLGFAETYQGDVADYDAFASAYAILDDQYTVTEPHVPLDVVGYSSVAVRVAAARSSGGPQRTFGVTWSRLLPSPVPDRVTFGLYSGPTEGPAGPYCSYSPVSSSCPCGNVGGPGYGCGNSTNAAGALLSAAGSHALPTDSFVLTASGMPPTATCLFFQGTAQVYTTFGDGVRCAGGTTIRLGIKTAAGGVAAYPTGADARVSLKGLLPAAGGRRYYQVWYRDSASYRTASSFNLTNGYAATWLP